MFSIFGLLHVFIGCAGGIGAALALYLLLRSRRLTFSPFGIALANLALNQLGFAMFGHLTFIVPTYFANRWLWGLRACEFFGYLSTHFQRNILGSIALICLERYMTHVRKNKPRTIMKFVIYIWMYNTIWALFPFVGWGRYERRAYACSLLLVPFDWNWTDFSYTLFQLFGTIVVPSALMFHVLRLTHRRSAVKVTSSGQWNTDPMSTMQVTKSLAVAVFLLQFAISVVGFSDRDSFKKGDNHGLEHVHLLLTHLMCWISPIFYWTHVPSIRREMRRRRKTRVSFVEEVPLRSMT